MPSTHSIRQLAINRERRRAWIAENGPCRCGSEQDLQVDHVDPSTKVSHNVWSWSEKRRVVELAKCQVLCDECHKKKTAQMLTIVAHGMVWAYQHYGCRCPLCCEAKRKENREFRDKRRKNQFSCRTLRGGPQVILPTEGTHVP